MVQWGKLRLQHMNVIILLLFLFVVIMSLNQQSSLQQNNKQGFWTVSILFPPNFIQRGQLKNDWTATSLWYIDKL